MICLAFDVCVYFYVNSQEIREIVWSVQSEGLPLSTTLNHPETAEIPKLGPREEKQNVSLF